jgi:cation transport ATPase
MKKLTYKLKGIDCADCGLKVEERLNRTNGIYEANFNFILMKLMLSYEESIINEEEIEEHIHKSLSGVRIIAKNNVPFYDTYEEPNIIKQILFGRKNKKQ